MIMIMICIVHILRKINKYECRTGPFEGFFVSSVEFCKYNKFDDKDDNKDRKDNNITGTTRSTRPQVRLLAHRVLGVHQALLAHRVQKVIQEQLVLLVHKEYRVNADLTERKVHQGPLESLMSQRHMLYGKMLTMRSFLEPVRH